MKLFTENGAFASILDAIDTVVFWKKSSWTSKLGRATVGTVELARREPVSIFFILADLLECFE